jgi:transmembrane sensor
MNFSNYSAKDFILDETFQKWTLESDREAKIFWDKWLNEHPDKADIITEARITILTIRDAFEKNVSNDQAQVWDRIANSIQTDEAILRQIRETENTK